MSELDLSIPNNTVYNTDGSRTINPDTQEPQWYTTSLKNKTGHERFRQFLKNNQWTVGPTQTVEVGKKSRFKMYYCHFQKKGRNYL
jgi:hypothetical protein